MCVSCVRALKSAACLLTKTTSCSGLMRNSLAKTPSLIGATRNVWSIAKFRQTLPVVGQVISTNWRGWNTSSARYSHADADRELAEFLKDDIKVEKENTPKAPKLSKIKDFVVAKAEGPKVTLTKTSGSETITVKFNVNNTIEESLMHMDEKDELNQSEDSVVASRPPFVVEINKGGEKTLAIQCIYNQDNLSSPAEEGQQEAFDEPIEIQELTVLNKSQEWTDDVYILPGGIMDGNLYALMMNYLEQRGIDGEFLDQLVDFSTSYEHKKYIGLLEELKGFVESK